MNTKQARSGGEVSNVNGLFYKGGQFMPWLVDGDGRKAKKSSGKSAKDKKQNVTPFVWELPPYSGAQSILGLIGGTWSNRIEVDGQASLNQGYADYVANTSPDFDQQNILDLIAAYNSGERWVYNSRFEW